MHSPLLPAGAGTPPARDPRLGASASAMIGAMDARGVDWPAQDWDDLVPRLLLLAISRLHRMTWRGERRGQPPGAAEADDFVNDAISKTLAGIRVWSPGACSLFQHLAGVIVSDISHAAGSLENRATRRGTIAAGAEPGATLDVGDDAPDQEATVIWRSEQRRLLGYLDGVDPELRRMAELMLVQDLRETGDLCRALDIPPAEVANRRKRLKRAVRNYLTDIAT